MKIYYIDGGVLDCHTLAFSGEGNVLYADDIYEVDCDEILRITDDEEEA